MALADRILHGAWTSSEAYDAAIQDLANHVLAQSGAADSVPPAVPSEHGLQNAVPAPGGSKPPGDSRARPATTGSFASFACCNQCSSEHHHCPNCGNYVKGEEVVYCSTRCEREHKAV